jgi:hypothetical protein
VAIVEPSTTTYTNGALAVRIQIFGPTPSRVELLIDDSHSITVPSPYQYSLDTGSLAEGAHVLKARSLVNGQTLDSAPRTVIVDRTPPRVVFYRPDAGADEVIASPVVQLKFDEPVLLDSLVAHFQRVGGSVLNFLPQLSANGLELVVQLEGAPAPAVIAASVVIRDRAGNPSEPLEWSWSAPAWLGVTPPLELPPSQLQASALAHDAWGYLTVLALEPENGLVRRYASPWGGTLAWMERYPFPAAGAGVSFSVAGDLVVLPDPYPNWDYTNDILGARLQGTGPGGARVFDRYYVHGTIWDSPMLLEPGDSSLTVVRAPDGGVLVGVTTPPQGAMSSVVQIRDLDGGVVAEPGELLAGAGVVASADSAAISVDPAGRYHVWAFGWDGVASAPLLFEWEGSGWKPPSVAPPDRCALQDVRALYDVAAGEPRVLCLNEGGVPIVFRGTRPTDAFPAVPVSVEADRVVGLTHDSEAHPVVLLSGSVSRLFRFGPQGWEQVGLDLPVTFPDDPLGSGTVSRRLTCTVSPVFCHVLVTGQAADGTANFTILTPNL